MKNLTSPNEPLQANEAKEGSHSLEADQRIVCISIISITYTLAAATAATTTPALRDYSWTLMHRSCRAAPCLLHQLLPSPSRAQAPCAWQHAADKVTAHLPLAGETQEKESLCSRQACSFALLTTHCDGRQVCFSRCHLEVRLWPEKGLGRQVCRGGILFTAEPQQPLCRAGFQGAVFHSHLLEPKQNENLSHPDHVSSSALGTAQQARTELV